MAEIQCDTYKQLDFRIWNRRNGDDAYAGAGVSDCDACSDEWLPLFGDEVLESKFQDGHYVYSVVAGGGSGDDVFPPVLYVADVENAVDFNSVLEP